MLDVLIIGAGFSGVGMAIALKKAHIGSFAVLERADDVGGTWHENRYPGCACDIPSVLYSFSFEHASEATRTYPTREELWAYLRRCCEKYGVLPHVRFGVTVIEARYDEADCAWVVRTSDQTFRTRVLVWATGPLNRARIPEIAGLERFAGRTVHSSRWDASFDVRGKQVAVIGTGASAIQIIPEIAPSAERITVFQRTAPWILPKANRELSARERRLLKFAPYRWVRRAYTYLFLESRALGFTVDPKMVASFESMARRFLERSVADPELRALLTPDYRMGCKRVLLSSDYYAALQRDDVELVGGAVCEIREHGVVGADGFEYPADAIVFATGFNAAEAPESSAIFGAGGRELAEAWREGPEAYLGVSVAGFPNLFFLAGPNTGLGHNSMVYMIESQIHYVISALRYLHGSQGRILDVRAGAQRDFNAGLQEQMKHTVWSSGCTSWYLDRNGKNTTLWPSFTFAYRFLTRRLRPERYETAK